MSRHLSGVCAAEQSRAHCSNLFGPSSITTTQLAFDLDAAPMITIHFFKKSELKLLGRGNALEAVCGTTTI